MNPLDTTDTGDAASVMPEEAPPPRLSFVRVLIATLLVAAVAGTAAYAITRHAVPAVEISAPAFAPYVDVTLTPTYAFQNPLANPVQRVVLGFVVADPSHRCAPSWGGYYSPSQAESALNLDQRVTQVRNQGGAPTLSFGGQANTELAVSCASVPALSQAYQGVLQRYGVATADFDIEGSALGDRRPTRVARWRSRWSSTGSRRAAAGFVSGSPSPSPRPDSRRRASTSFDRCSPPGWRSAG